MAIFALMMWLQLISTAKSEYTDVYNFPMLGILQYDTSATPYRWITYGSVTVAHTKMVIAAAENLCQLEPSGKAFIFREDLRRKLSVTVSSDLLNPPDDYESDKIKRIQVDFIYFGKSSRFASGMNETTLKDRKRFAKTWEWIQQPAPSLQGTTLADIYAFGYDRNPFGELQWDIALLTLEEALVWGPYVLPIPNLIWHQTSQRNYLLENYRKTWDHVEIAEQSPHEFPPCVVPGWSPIGNNEIIYHKVVYIRFKECAEAICGAYPSACLQYLNVRHHICFKSLSFSDSCVLDQGAPVLCSWTKKHVLGILVKTWECGTEGLPTVFTRMDAISAFANILQEDSLSVSEPNLDDPNYTAAPK